MEKVLEKWTSKINEMVIGATKEEGGTRSKKVHIGGETTLPFLHFEGEIPYPPVVALEVWDIPPEEWSFISEDLKEVVNDPLLWAKKVEEWGADLLCFRLASAHPEKDDTSPEKCAEKVKKILETVKLPLIILGCGQPDKDGEILLKVSEVAKGENCLLGMAAKDNYKTVVAAATYGGHSIIAETPLDINLEKQLNILITDLGFLAERIIAHPTTGGLGYGFEYCYSIMERTRIAGLQGDKMMAIPIINLVAQETWKHKEAKVNENEAPQWGVLNKRAIAWETTCAVGYLQSGADILVLAHPQSLINVKKAISELMIKT
ncbi:MAG TPA: acetyl-CoA decarbonylase/synthase complex subunit delta [Elusimicrobia bacterium]|jgi:acetyl-CoA decarbonylase/synthase complex subunit delta|nr:acetyl-CoA decarbonylase/synthase complex subunit delta [Elusimicrobiota bacterium]